MQTAAHWEMPLELKNLYPVLGTPNGGEPTVFLTGFSCWVSSSKYALYFKKIEIDLLAAVCKMELLL
jgi:hypothetical protein